MLTALRRLAGTWVAKILFVLLILSFAVWGIEDMVRNFGRDDSVARVAGQPIPFEEAQAAMRRETTRLQRQLGPSFEIDDGIRRALAASAIESLVQDRAMRAEAQRRNVTVPETAVRDFIFAIPGLRGLDGRFSRDVFNRFLQTNETTEARFLDLVRHELSRQQITGAVRAGAAAPPALVRPLLAWARERRSADIAFFELIEAEEPEPPTEAQLRRFHENNPQVFSTPEFRDATIAVLVTRDITADVQVTEAQIAEGYAQRRAQFETPERRALRQVVVASEDAARAIAEAWRGGADNAAIEARAREAGGQVVEIPATDRAAIPFPALAEAAFAASEGSVADPVRGPFGWVVLRVESVEPGSVRPLAEVRDEVRFEIAYDRALDIGYERANRIEDALAGSTALAEVARAQGMALVTLRVNAQGRTAEGTVPTLPGPETMRRDLLRALFAARQGDQPRLTETLDGWYALELREVAPPALRPFETVEAAVRQAWITDARRRSQEGRAARLLAAIQGGKALIEAAGELQFRADRFGPFSREPEAGSAVSAELLAPLFEAAVGAPVMVPTRSGYAVAQLAEIIPFDPDSDAEALDSLRRETEQRMADDLDAQFQAAVRARADVRINQTRAGALAGR